MKGNLVHCAGQDDGPRHGEDKLPVAGKEVQAGRRQIGGQGLGPQGGQHHKEGGGHPRKNGGALNGGHRHRAPQAGGVGIDQGDYRREHHPPLSGQAQGEEDGPPRQQLAGQEGHAAEYAGHAVDQTGGRALIPLGEVVGQGDKLVPVDEVGQGGGDEVGEAAADAVPGPGKAEACAVLRAADDKAAADLAADGAARQQEQGGLAGGGDGVLKAGGPPLCPPANEVHTGPVEQQNKQYNGGCHRERPLSVKSTEKGAPEYGSGALRVS